MTTFFKDAENHFLASISADATAPKGYTALEANTTDAAQEKHVPVVAIENDGRLIHVTVGSTEHPMQEDHYIEWIALDAGNRFEMHMLKPGQSPTAFFPGGVESGTVYAYCNLHGLWKAEFK